MTHEAAKIKLHTRTKYNLQIKNNNAHHNMVCCADHCWQDTKQLIL